MNVSTKAISTSKFKLLGSPIVALLIMLFLASCSKNADVMPDQFNTQVSAMNASSPSGMNDKMVAVPFLETLFVPCGNSGAGENVTLSGSMNFVYQMTWNDHGFSLVYHTNSRGITGVGLSSGEMFLGSVGTNGSVMGSWVNNQWIGSTIERMRIIGQNTMYVVKYKNQLVVTPDGKVTVKTSEKTIDCIR